METVRQARRPCDRHHGGSFKTSQMHHHRNISAKPQTHRQPKATGGPPVRVDVTQEPLRREKQEISIRKRETGTQAPPTSPQGTAHDATRSRYPTSTHACLLKLRHARADTTGRHAHRNHRTGTRAISAG